MKQFKIPVLILSGLTHGQRHYSHCDVMLQSQSNDLAGCALMTVALSLNGRAVRATAEPNAALTPLAKRVVDIGAG